MRTALSVPRPSLAQLAYGWVTVLVSTTAMILLSQARSGFAIVLICVTALALGVLVAVTAPSPRRRTAAPTAEPLTARVPAQGRRVAEPDRELV
ncbi:hypothetical protein G5C51_35335 [Streptomyces sp. A7024]|uniref:Uncharacterized protein n=1 Tax=Streptomyces coryli TaxID=1128680 RepID=A0A6G4UA94_9ACTN|nr:hypothetical protein [Streptomyces coryli]NGN69149.1 hypothetical protein [Streptomyces coryli]